VQKLNTYHGCIESTEAHVVNQEHIFDRQSIFFHCFLALFFGSIISKDVLKIFHFLTNCYLDKSQINLFTNVVQLERYQKKNFSNNLGWDSKKHLTAVLTSFPRQGRLKYKRVTSEAMITYGIRRTPI